MGQKNLENFNYDDNIYEVIFMKKLIYSLALTGTICLGMASQASATNLQTIALQQKDSYAVSDDSISTYDFTRDYTDYYYIKEDYQKVMEDVNWDIFNDTSVNVSLKSTEGPSQFSVKVYQKEDGGSKWKEVGTKTIKSGSSASFKIKENYTFKVEANATSGENGNATITVSLS